MGHAIESIAWSCLQTTNHFFGHYSGPLIIIIVIVILSDEMSPKTNKMVDRSGLDL